MSFRAVQVITQARKIAEQQLLSETHKAELADDPFLDFEDVRAFFEFTAARAASYLVMSHAHAKAWWFMKVELIYAPLVARSLTGYDVVHRLGEQN